MKKIIISILVIILLFSTSSFGFSVSYFSKNTNKKIYMEIEETKDKILVVDKIIGDIYVKYWEHVIDDVYIKNDFILLHLDPKTNDILEFEKIWTDIELNLNDFKDNKLMVKDYIWKKAVVIPDENYNNLYYTFYSPMMSYPLVCWEVRHNDGATLLYDLEGKQIGYEIPTPWSESVVIQGYGENSWHYWRGNAQEWFNKWCDSTQSKLSPDLSWVSERISDPDVELFYVIAHSGGQSDRFLINNDVYYNTTRLINDMSDRGPIKMAILCCCSAMVDTGPGTLSYEFRKGEMTDTVTIGYFNMGSCPDWTQSLDWQDFMFKKIDAGFTIKNAFNRACAYYPKIADYVKFIGDPDIKLADIILQMNEYSLNENEANVVLEVTNFIFSENAQIIQSNIECTIPTSTSSCNATSI